MNKIKSFIQSLSRNQFKYLIIGVIILLNAVLYLISENVAITNIQRRLDASGFSHDKGQHFAYFHYYKNLFPLSTLDTNLTYSKAAADSLIKERGENLIMEYQHWSRLGENARIFAYLPNSIIRGSPKNPSVKLFNFLSFTLSLIFCFISFHSIEQTLLGLLLVFTINLTPFFWYEIFDNENIFGLLGSVLLLVIALNIKLIFNEKIKSWAIISPAFSGLLIGVFSEIRGELSIILVSALFIYFISKSLKIIQKPIYILLLVGSFYASKQYISSYFDSKFAEAYNIVKENGGHTYDGGKIKRHKLWHPIFCGLGDFDNKYGYQWNDRVAYKYAIPILKSKYNLDLKYSGKLHLDEYYDEDKIYYKKFDEIDEYEEIMKEKVLSDISNDPLWYFSIILKRINRILISTLPFPLLGYVMLFLLYYLFLHRKHELINLLLLSIPLSFTPLFIYSGDQSTYNSFFGFIVLVVILEIFIKKYIVRDKRLSNEF
ncbi:MAG: hypothetical protein J5I47_05305 [Vicingus serpentipes]|nr:hypothetical protein [Vicingus serpentipes]